MFKSKLKLENERLKKELEENKLMMSYNNNKIEDDFNVLNQILDLKTSHYETVTFVFNRYQEDKKVNVSDTEINEATETIISQTFSALSDKYIDYLSNKYFNSREALIETYTQRIYIRLFSLGNTYNTSKTESDFKKNK